MWRCTKKDLSKALTEVMIRKLRGDLGNNKAMETKKKWDSRKKNMTDGS